MSSSSSPLPARCRLCFQHLPMVDWSQLPYDLIVLIAKKLHAVEDFLAFSAVCHSWRLIYLNKNWAPSRRIPWLMLNENHNGEVSVRHFFSIYKNKTYKLPLPEAHGRRCWGSSHGWVVTIGNDLVINLLNPITHVCVDLPPQSTLGNNVHTNIDWFNFIHKANVFKIRDGFVIMAIYGQQYSLAFARPGDSAWTTVQISSRPLFINVMCCKGQIYALTIVGTLVLVEIDGPNPPRAKYVASAPQDERGWKQIHLAESSGDLLMIFRYDVCCRDSNLKFKVYKFDFNANKWMILESLGNRALFVDDSYAVSISARDDLECNSIYFVKDNLGWWLALKQEYEWQYCGVYHMEDETVETFSLNMPNWAADSLQYICPMWLFPTL